MNRRAFTVALVGLVVAPQVAGAQPAGKTYRIGWLSPASAENGKPNLDALRDGLREHAYMVINAKAAKAFGLTIPQTLLLRADQVMQ